MNDSTAATYRPINEKSVQIENVEKHTAFAVIKKRTLLGVIYFLEHRKRSDSWAGRYALYGGKRKDGERSYESVLARELDEELGVPAQDNDLISQHFLITPRQNGKMTAKEIFTLQDRRFNPYLVTARIEKKVRLRNQTHPNDPIGYPKKIRRIGRLWLFNSWHKLTPAAAYALLDDCEQSTKGR